MAAIGSSAEEDRAGRSGWFAGPSEAPWRAAPGSRSTPRASESPRPSRSLLDHGRHASPSLALSIVAPSTAAHAADSRLCTFDSFPTAWPVKARAPTPSAASTTAVSMATTSSHDTCFQTRFSRPMRPGAGRVRWHVEAGRFRRGPIGAGFSVPLEHCSVRMNVPLVNAHERPAGRPRGTSCRNAMSGSLRPLR
jgi:hypothetical protein